MKYVFCNLLALVLTVSLAIVEAEGKDAGLNSNPTTSSGSSSRPSTSSTSGSKKKTKKVKDKNTKITRCYNEQ